MISSRKLSSRGVESVLTGNAQTNASIVRHLASAVARVAPTACVLVFSDPVNSTVPVVAATLEKAGVYDPKRVFGVTTIDVVRATRFLAGLTSSKPSDTPVTVVGGHSGATIVPLLSQSNSGKSVAGEAYEKLVHRIQFGGDEVVQARTVQAAPPSPWRGRHTDVCQEPAVRRPGDRFFLVHVELGPNGVEKIHPIGELSAEEKKLLEACLPELKKNIEKGKAYVAALSHR
ncbi:lactate dehydrogenase/glycoside hydrolase [Mycena leptocephala]|nr:lactate dehydrogenase/glycoside hydrolase [Mycena leptocephala]